MVIRHLVLFFMLVAAVPAHAAATTWADAAKLAAPRDNRLATAAKSKPVTADQSIYNALSRSWRLYHSEARQNCVPLAFVEPQVQPRGGVTGDSMGLANRIKRNNLFSQFNQLRSKWELAAARYKNSDEGYDVLLNELFLLQRQEANLYFVYADNQLYDGAALAEQSGERAVTSWKMNQAESATRNITANYPGSTYNCYTGTGTVNYGSEQALFANHTLYKTTSYDSGFNTEVSHNDDIFYVTYSLGSAASLASVGVIYSKTGAALAAINAPLDFNRRASATKAAKGTYNAYDLSAKQIVQMAQRVYDRWYTKLGMADFAGRLLLDEKFRNTVADQLNNLLKEERS